MILYCAILLGILIFFSRGYSVLGFFFAMEVLFFIFIFFTGLVGSSLSFIFSLSLVVGTSVLMLTFLVSTMNFFGSDNQSVFLD